MSLLRPPVLRAGSLDAARVPSRMGERLVPHTVVDLGPVATAPQLPASKHTAEQRAAAIAEIRALIERHGITADQLFPGATP